MDVIWKNEDLDPSKFTRPVVTIGNFRYLVLAAAVSRWAFQARATTHMSHCAAPAPGPFILRCSMTGQARRSASADRSRN